jgi:hypothetical protein
VGGGGLQKTVRASAKKKSMKRESTTQKLPNGSMNEKKIVLGELESMLLGFNHHH